MEVSHEQLLPPDVLKKGQRNQVIFDNVRNPPATETWRIWNIWVEIVPLPEMPNDDLVREATKAFQHAQQLMDRRDVGARNRYEAWKECRNAWLMMEAHSNPKPELYTLARSMVREVQQEMDRECSKLMLEAMTSFQHNDWNGARATLDHVKDFFPGTSPGQAATDQPCPWRAEQKRNELGL
jgi:hypothetical protein